MKHLKTFLAAIAMLTMTFSFAACTNANNSANTGNNGNTEISGGNDNSTGDNNGSSNNGNSSSGNDNNNSSNDNDDNLPDSGEADKPTGGDTPDSGDSSEDDGKDDNTDNTDGKILVVYFSCTNNTESVAQKIQTATGSAIYEITPTIPYTTADLNYSNSNCRANQEQRNSSSRPEISGGVENIEQYSTIFIGYPIWWNDAPRIIYTFLDSYDFSGKTLIPFCTSGGSGIGGSERNLKAYKTDVTWLGGREFSASASQSTITSWVNGLNY